MYIKEVAEKLTAWLDAKLEETGTDSFIIGLSGGIDSAVVAALCAKVRPKNTFGYTMPCYSDSDDAMYGIMVAEAYDIPYKVIVLDEVFDTLLSKLTDECYQDNITNLAFANIKPRLRMTTLYFYAAAHNGLVIGTGNKAELTVGFFTKYGDGGCDLQPLANLTKTQVFELAEYLGVPQPIIDKPPSAGLWEDHDDEDEMGITYQQLDHYLETGEAEPKVMKIIQKLNEKNAHKRSVPPTPPDIDKDA